MLKSASAEQPSLTLGRPSATFGVVELCNFVILDPRHFLCQTWGSMTKLLDMWEWNSILPLVIWIVLGGCSSMKTIHCLRPKTSESIILQTQHCHAPALMLPRSRSNAATLPPQCCHTPVLLQPLYRHDSYSTAATLLPFLKHTDTLICHASATLLLLFLLFCCHAFAVLWHTHLPHFWLLTFSRHTTDTLLAPLLPHFLEINRNLNVYIYI